MNGRRSSLLLYEKSIQILQENGVSNTTAFINFLISSWGKHVKEGGRNVIDKVVKDLDVYAIYEKAMEGFKSDN